MIAYFKSLLSAAAGALTFGLLSPRAAAAATKTWRFRSRRRFRRPALPE